MKSDVDWFTQYVAVNTNYQTIPIAAFQSLRAKRQRMSPRRLPVTASLFSYRQAALSIVGNGIAYAPHNSLAPNLAKHSNSMAILTNNKAYQTFLLDVIPGAERTAGGQPTVEPDWTVHLELETTKELARRSLGVQRRLKVLVLYGSLRER